MNKTVLRLRRETSQSLKTDKHIVTPYAGYLLKITVESAHNIYPEIFVMQRDVYTPYSGEYTDTFYSIASVAELEFLPVGAPTPESTNFYRTSTVELMFETPIELEESWQKISAEVLYLAEANDLSINLESDIIATYPLDAFLRYYGPSVETPVSDDIKLLSQDSVYSLALNKEFEFNDNKHFTFAYPAQLGVGYLSVDGAACGTSSSDLNITTQYNQIVPYKVYTTIEPLSDGLHLIKFST